MTGAAKTWLRSHSSRAITIDTCGEVYRVYAYRKDMRGLTAMACGEDADTVIDEAIAKLTKKEGPE